MSIAAAQASAFYAEVASTGKLYTVHDAGGYPAPMTSSNKRAQPFWSSRSRAEKIIANVIAYAKFEVEEVSWDNFKQTIGPDLTNHNMLVGVNWSGARAQGYDLEINDLIANVEYQRNRTGS